MTAPGRWSTKAASPTAPATRPRSSPRPPSWPAPRSARAAWSRSASKAKPATFRGGEDGQQRPEEQQEGSPQAQEGQGRRRPGGVPVRGHQRQEVARVAATPYLIDTSRSDHPAYPRPVLGGERAG